MARGRRWTDEENQLIGQLYAEGASVEEIAGKLPQDRTFNATERQIDRLGLRRGGRLSEQSKKSNVPTIEGAEVMSREEALKVLAAVIKKLQSGGEMNEIDLGCFRTIVSAVGRYFTVFDSYEKYAELEARMKRMEAIVEQIRGKG
jgi:hypothetical protein